MGTAMILNDKIFDVLKRIEQGKLTKEQAMLELKRLSALWKVFPTSTNKNFINRID